MIIKRFLNWLYAKWNGYFWLPCVLCGVKRGGHTIVLNDEWWHCIPTDNKNTRQGVCPDCGYALGLRRLNDDSSHPFDNWLIRFQRTNGYKSFSIQMSKGKEFHIASAMEDTPPPTHRSYKTPEEAESDRTANYVASGTDVYSTATYTTSYDGVINQMTTYTNGPSHFNNEPNE